ncbi:very-long-chain 3-oxoacyl-CoA reductase-like [Paramacrobiotus metropolitanus]|uniref:very-long-chain 3-oxoacyl-CoA reductase-like n=1 Tax=Paramacrobiotus metropolitanus TaxID=2943436 RepID=UPI0024460FFE|nr:very-long-chain 3-oxoacyl-CoA reductase-like [Paramacrobiotus metropolitanus]
MAAASGSVFAFLGPLEACFALIGTLIVISFVICTLYFLGKNIYVFFFAERLGHTVDFKNLGEWAVVTGATDGIGKGYALDLARRGCNIILISRSEEKLRNVAKEIASKYNVRTRIVVADFSSDETIYDKIKSDLEGLEIGTLINNVGVGAPYPEYFHRMVGGDQTALNMIRVNCVAQTLMTRIILPQMVARKKGVIVHLSSGAGSAPVPMLAEYSATKAFNDFLGRALQQEYEDQGIISQVIMPYVVATNMSGMKKTNLFILESESYARSCLNSVGFLPRTNGHPSHCIQNWLGSMIPYFLRARLMRSMMEKWRDMSIAKLKKKGEYKGE